jgi:tRNA-dihydrouridine synthase
MIRHAGSTQFEKSTDRWKLERLLLDRWRRELTEVDIELKRPKVVDPLLADSASGEAVDGEGAVKRFRGQIIYFTDEAVTIRRPCGAILVLGNDEILDLSDGQDHLEL